MRQALQSAWLRRGALACLLWPLSLVYGALVDAAKHGKDSVVIISADATAAHQSVITVMEAARRSGLNQITFATQPSAQAGRR